MNNKFVLIVVFIFAFLIGFYGQKWLSQRDPYQGVLQMKVFVHTTIPFEGTGVKVYLCGKSDYVKDNFDDEIVVVGTEDIPANTQISVEKLEYSWHSKDIFPPKTILWLVKK
jgi:hypothetical protein